MISIHNKILSIIQYGIAISLFCCINITSAYASGNNPPSFDFTQPIGFGLLGGIGFGSSDETENEYHVYANAGQVLYPAFIREVRDGEGGIQLPNGGGNSSDIIRFEVSSNSNPDLFSNQPWVSYPSHALHYVPRVDVEGKADICVKAVDHDGNGLYSEEKCFVLAVRESRNPNKFAHIITPIPGATLTDSSVTVSWESDEPIYGLSIVVKSADPETGEVIEHVRDGISSASPDPVSSSGSYTITDLPTDGRTIIVRLFSTVRPWRHHGSAIQQTLDAFYIAANTYETNHAPSFRLQQPAVYNTDAGAEEVTVPAWVTEAYDGEGGTQLPNGGGNSSDRIHFEVTSNSNPSLFRRGPLWVSYPSHALHFKTNFLASGSADVCIKAVDLNGTGLSSESQCFTINIRKPRSGNPTFISPEPGSTLTGSSVTIRWETTGISDIRHQSIIFGERSIPLEPDARSVTVLLPAETSRGIRVMLYYTTSDEVRANFVWQKKVVSYMIETRTVTPETASSDKAGGSSGGSFSSTMLAFLVALGFLRRKYGRKSLHKTSAG